MLGGEPGQYRLHSLRAGAATDAETDGTHLCEILFQDVGSQLQYSSPGAMAKDVHRNWDDKYET